MSELQHKKHLEPPFNLPRVIYKASSSSSQSPFISFSNTLHQVLKHSSWKQIYLHSRNLSPIMKLLFFAPLLALVAAENLQWCGDARYYPSQYTCFGTKLCPKQNGEVYLPCGAACYSTNMYYCDNGALKLWNPIQEPLLHCSGQPYYASKVCTSRYLD